MIVYQGRNNKLIKSTMLANKYLSSDSLTIDLLGKDQFDMATCKTSHILMSLEKFSHLSCECVGYYKRFSRAYGYFDENEPRKFFINEAKLNRSLGSIAASLVHEYIHFLDELDVYAYYGHGDNSPVGKSNTAPYYIDNLAEANINGVEPDFNNNESSRIYKKTSIWNKLKRFFRFI